MAINKWFNKNKEKPRCTHQWDVIAVTYAPPVSQVPQNVKDSSTLERIVFGVTSYIQECKYCGENKKYEMLGSVSSELKDILAKVEKFGMQYVKDGNNTYAIAKWVPEVKTPLK